MLRQILGIGLAAAAGFALTWLVMTPNSLAMFTGSADCRIKGNVSFYSGERIYHVPGQHWYDETEIDLLNGERWFCSEAEAKAAGWRRAGD